VHLRTPLFALVVGDTDAGGLRCRVVPGGAEDWGNRGTCRIPVTCCWAWKYLPILSSGERALRRGRELRFGPRSNDGVRFFRDRSGDLCRSGSLLLRSLLVLLGDRRLWGEIFLALRSTGFRRLGHVGALWCTLKLLFLCFEARRLRDLCRFAGRERECRLGDLCRLVDLSCLGGCVALAAVSPSRSGAFPWLGDLCRFTSGSMPIRRLLRACWPSGHVHTNFWKSPLTCAFGLPAGSTGSDDRRGGLVGLVGDGEGTASHACESCEGFNDLRRMAPTGDPIAFVAWRQGGGEVGGLLLSMLGRGALPMTAALLGPGRLALPPQIARREAFAAGVF